MAKPNKTPKDPVVADLEEIAILAAWFEIDVIAATPDPGISTAIEPESKPPVDLTLISDLDETWNCLTTWTRDWCDTFHLTGPSTPTWDTLTHWLTIHWPRTQRDHPAPEVFRQEVHDHLRVLRYHQGADQAWKPLPGRWACPVELEDGTCGGILREHVAKRRIVCETCQSTWVGEQQYASLGRALKVEPFVNLKQAAALKGVSVRTVQRWIALGALPAHRREGEVVVDRLDLALAKEQAQMMARRTARYLTT